MKKSVKAENIAFEKVTVGLLSSLNRADNANFDGSEIYIGYNKQQPNLS